MSGTKRNILKMRFPYSCLSGETSQGVRTAEDVYAWIAQQLRDGPIVSQRWNVFDVFHLATLVAYATDWDPWVQWNTETTVQVVRGACQRLVSDGVLARVGSGLYRRVKHLS